MTKPIALARATPDSEDLLGQDDLLVQIDTQLAAAAVRAGHHLACYQGCAVCCFGPFPITHLDAERLRTGLASMAPQTAEAILERAARARQRLSAAYPGDAQTGALAPDTDEAVFAARFADLACPVLDPDSGGCLLYESRPVACRLYGLPSRINGEDLPHCPLCFRRADESEIENARAVLNLPDESTDEPRTVVAYAFRGASPLPTKIL